MLKNAMKMISLMLVFVMTVCIFAGCGDKPADKTDGDKNNNNSEKKIEFLVDPEDYRGTKVVYATWKDPEKNEDGPVVKAFEEKYGIDVEIMLLHQGQYVSLIAAAIAAGNQPDIFFETGFFPSALSVMQPLDAAKINYEDPIWRQSTIKNSTIDGHPYFIDAVSNVWSEMDICVYNKKIFEDNNITTPQEYYDAGKWTFEAFRECAKQVSALGKGYLGAQVRGNVALAAAGCDIVSYKDGKFKTNIDNHLYDVMTFLAQMRADGYIKQGLEEFTDGKTGMALTNCFGLKRTGFFSTINPDHIAAVPTPVWGENGKHYTAGIHRAWGLVKGAKNPVAAGIFLREYLDVNNYDLDNTFHNREVANFFFKVTGAEDENMMYYFAPDEYYNIWDVYSPAQVKGYLDGQINVLENYCTKNNEILATEKEWLADNF